MSADEPFDEWGRALSAGPRLLYCPRCGAGPYKDLGHAAAFRYHLRAQHPEMRCRARMLAIAEARSS